MASQFCRHTCRTNRCHSLHPIATQSTRTTITRTAQGHIHATLSKAQGAVTHAPAFFAWETCKKRCGMRPPNRMFSLKYRVSVHKATCIPLAFLNCVGFFVVRVSVGQEKQTTPRPRRFGRWRCVVSASAAGEERGKHRGGQRSSHQSHDNHRIKLAPGRPLRCTAPGAAPRKVISPESSKRWIWRVPPNQAGWIRRHFLWCYLND